MEGSQNKSHENHIAGREVNSLSHYSLVHKFILMPQAMEISDAKAAVEKLEKSGENTSMAADESQNKMEVIAEARNKGEN